MDQHLSVLKIAERIPDEASAYKFLEDLRWGEDLAGQACPHCGVIGGAYYIRPLNGATRATRTGSASARRVWKCAACRKQFSVLTGTIFHGTKIPVRTWIFVIFEMCASKNGVAAREIERKYDVTAKSAWFMLHRIREAMKRDPLAGMLRGTIVADETYMGGKPTNKHRQGKGRQPVGPRAKSTTGSPYDKTAVLTLVSKDTGEAHSQVLATVTDETLAAAMAGRWTQSAPCSIPMNSLPTAS